MYQGENATGEPLVAGGDPPELLNLVYQPLGPVLVLIGVNVDRPFNCGRALAENLPRDPGTHHLKLDLLSILRLASDHLVYFCYASRHGLAGLLELRPIPRLSRCKLDCIGDALVPTSLVNLGAIAAPASPSRLDGSSLLVSLAARPGCKPGRAVSRTNGSNLSSECSCIRRANTPARFRCLNCWSTAIANAGHYSRSAPHKPVCVSHENVSKKPRSDRLGFVPAHSRNSCSTNDSRTSKLVS